MLKLLFETPATSLEDLVFRVLYSFLALTLLIWTIERVVDVWQLDVVRFWKWLCTRRSQPPQDVELQVAIDTFAEIEPAEYPRWQAATRLSDRTLREIELDAQYRIICEEARRSGAQ